MVSWMYEQYCILIDIHRRLVFRITAQNAGLIVRRPAEGKVSIEAFELSPTNEAVYADTGRLRRCFPGPAMEFSLDDMTNPAFSKAFAQFMTQLDTDTPAEALPLVTKANEKVVEVRDTVHPMFITQLMMGMLRGMGQPHATVRIHKHTHEEVSYDDAYMPWRRSPLWLLIRVALQTSLMSDEDHSDYKSFMIFFMAQLVEQAVKTNCPSDMLFIMTAKISRRVLKYDVCQDTKWMKCVRQIVAANQLELRTRWKNYQIEDGLPKAKFPECSTNWETDTHLSLHELSPYLDKVKDWSASSVSNDTYSPDCPVRVSHVSNEFPDRKLRFNKSNRPIKLRVMDIDEWVKTSLDEWIQIHLQDQTTCTQLADLVQEYSEAASDVYDDSPEFFSTKLLTLMELWVALDKSATYHEPLLMEYATGFSESLFESLLLPKKAEMERLARIEAHISTRNNSATYGSSLIFEQGSDPCSLAVRYYAQSAHHQRLFERIEKHATNTRHQKKKELIDLQALYADRLRRYQQQSCEYRTYRRRGRERTGHSKSCERCSIFKSAENMTISVHEWPLPSTKLNTMLAVFELDVPLDVISWRSTTFSMLVDVLSKPAMSETGQVYLLRNYSDLARYSGSNGKNRIGLASKTKSFLNSHYRGKKVSMATEENICVNNGLHYDPLIRENFSGQAWSLAMRHPKQVHVPAPFWYV